MISNVGALGVLRRLSKAPFLAAERVINVIPFENFGKNFPSVPSPKLIKKQYSFYNYDNNINDTYVCYAILCDDV